VKEAIFDVRDILSAELEDGDAVRIIARRNREYAYLVFIEQCQEGGRLPRLLLSAAGPQVPNDQAAQVSDVGGIDFVGPGRSQRPRHTGWVILDM
jgi:hypothetical protein